jgi:hypothetical protein
MFSDLVGSTALSARMDPEDLREVISAYQKLLVAESTRRLLGSLFELEDLGARDLKGMAEPVQAWAALRASSVESLIALIVTPDGFPLRYEVLAGNTSERPTLESAAGYRRLVSRSRPDTSLG